MVEDEVLFGKGQDDYNLAEWASDVLEGKWRYDFTAKQWHHWNGVRWAADKTNQISYTIASMAAKALDPTNHAVPAPSGESERKALMKLISLRTTERVAEALSTLPGYGTDGDDWDSDPHTLGCKNGIVDLRTNTLVPRPPPTVLVTKSTGVKFDPISGPADFDDRAPAFMRTMRQWMSGDDDMVAFLLFWYGSSLFGFSPEQRFLLMTGIGRNGKGALKHTLLVSLGDYAAELDPSLYMRSKFGGARSNEARADLVNLKGKRVTFFSEPSGGQFNEELLKAHTGGDRISARSLYSNHVQSWDPTHSITFLTNDLPAIEDIGPSMGDRVMVADFRESYEGDKQDRKLYDKLSAEKEGILAILVWAAGVWYERFESGDGGIILPERVKEQSKEFMERNDDVANWLNENCERGRDHSSASQLAYENYLSWFPQSGSVGEAKSSVKWAAALLKKGFRKEKTRTGIRWFGFDTLGAMRQAMRGIDEDENP